MRAIKLIFLAVMGTLLVLPAAEMIFPFIKLVPLQENRRLTQLPSLLKLMGEGRARLAPWINGWFDDNMGFRPLLTRINNQIDYSIFDYSRNVLVGKNGWLFETGWVDEPVKLERQGDQLQQQLADKIIELTQYLAARNIKLVVVSVPYSSTVYPEALPAAAPRIPKPSQFDKFTAFLKTRKDLLYVDGMDALIPHKDERIFYMTDVHYDPFGGYQVARAFVRAIAVSEGRSDPWTADMPFTTVTGWDGGVLAHFLSVFKTPVEPPYPGNGAGFDPKNPSEGGSFVSGPQPFEFVYRNKPGLDRLPPIMVVANSFVDWWLAVGAWENFSAVYRIRATPNDVGYFLKDIPPDTRYFLLLILEPQMGYLTSAQIPSP